jgi:hypothetical protein
MNVRVPTYVQRVRQRLTPAYAKCFERDRESLESDSTQESRTVAAIDAVASGNVSVDSERAALQKENSRHGELFRDG